METYPVGRFFFVINESNTKIQRIFERNFGKIVNKKSIKQDNDQNDNWEKFETTCVYLANKTKYDIKYLKSMFIIDFLKLFELMQKNERQNNNQKD